MAATAKVRPRFKDLYESEIRPKLIERFGYESPMQAPRLVKIILPEIDYDAIDQVRGLDITITTTAETDDEAFALLESFGMPFRRDEATGAAEFRRQQEEEQRKAEARAKAEAEQAALEQL